MQKGEDYIEVSVVYFCHDGKENVLLAQRSKNARDEQGRWDIGGGGVELGEAIIDTLKKEIKEEYSTDIINQEFLGYRDVFRKNNDKKTHWVTLDFKVLVDKEKVMSVMKGHPIPEETGIRTEDLQSIIEFYSR